MGATMEMNKAGSGDTRGVAGKESLDYCAHAPCPPARRYAMWTINAETLAKGRR